MELNYIKKPLGPHTKYTDGKAPSRWQQSKNIMKYIVIHQTGCDDCDADRMWRSYNNNPVPRSAGVHYFIDDINCFEMVEPQYITWNCGDGSNGTNTRKITNSNSIAIEICIFSDKVRYAKTLEHSALLVQYLMDK